MKRRNNISKSVKLDDYFDFLAPDDIRIKRHRVGIENILYYHLYRDRTPEEIQAELPTLSLDQIYATILYYLRNKKQVGKYLTDWIEFGRRARAEQRKNPTPFMIRIRKLKLSRTRARRARFDARSHRCLPWRSAIRVPRDSTPSTRTCSAGAKKTTTCS